MMLLVSPEQWANWDKWFNYTLPGYILILGIIFLFVGLIPFLCVHNKITYTLFGVTTVFLVTFLGIAYFKIRNQKNMSKKITI